jgi:hypothetical protein
MKGCSPKWIAWVKTFILRCVMENITNDVGYSFQQKKKVATKKKPWIREFNFHLSSLTGYLTICHPYD